MQRADYTNANRRAWNQVAPIHQQQQFDQLLANFQQPGYSCLDPIETDILQTIGITDRAVAQLCCNNGRELLSVKNMGAGRCVGFDISDAFIAQAQQLKSVSDIECTFVQTDIYDIPATYNGSFDLVFITIGVFGWMPDLPGFFQVIQRLLKPDGWFFAYEQHPILNMFEADGTETDKNIRFDHSYFRTEPFVDQDGLDYYGKTQYESAPTYWFPYTLSDIIDTCLSSGLVLTAFREYDHDLTNFFEHFEAFQAKLPLSYSLVAHQQV